MKEILTNKDNLFKYGFCIVRNLLDNKEVEKYRTTINEAIKKKGGETHCDLYNYKETWDYIVNDRLLNIIKNLLEENIFYLHDSSINSLKTKKNTLSNTSWHRDSACRRIGKGPDWDEDEPYKVLTVITYLSENNVTRSGLNVIPGSHKKTYKLNLSNILRIFHWRTRKIKFLQGIRNEIRNYIGVTCRTDPGDCVIFFCKLLHDVLPNTGLRQTIVTRFGPANKHSTNYVNYILKHRAKSFGYKIDDNNKSKVDDFFNLLKSKNIYYPLPEKKEEIIGVNVDQV